MPKSVFGIKNNIVDSKKIFWFMVFFELITMFVILYGDSAFWAYYFGIMLVPLLIISIPIEPSIGIVLMIVATGFDIMGVLYQFSSQMRLNLTVFHVALFLTIVSLVLNRLKKEQTTFHSLDLWPPLIAFILMLSFSLTYTPAFAQGLFPHFQGLAGFLL